jgi:deaminated glutathione amidase
MPRPLTIACLQTRPQADFQPALDKALQLAGEAVNSGAELLALPEYCGGLKTDGVTITPPAAPEEEHIVLQGLRKFANENDVWVVIGSIAVPGPDDRIYNRSFIVDPSGRISSRYDKIHMFDIQLSDTEVYRESALVCDGDRAVVTDTPFGKLGHSVCYDLRFPHLYRDLAKAGAEILMVPAAFTKKTGEAHWHVLNRARAIENGAFVLAPCSIGDIEGGGECYGHSLIIDPWGRVLADGGTETGITMATIDLDEVVAARARIPSLSHDRPYSLDEQRRRDVA